MERNRRREFEEIEREITDSIEFKKYIIENSKDRQQYEIFALDFASVSDFGHYARCFLDLIRIDEENGLIAPSKTTLIETTSGTAGRGLAFVARRLGYSIQIFMPTPLHRRRIEALLDMILSDPKSSVVETPSADYVAGAVRELKNFLAQKSPSTARPRSSHLLNHSRRQESVKSFHRLIKDAWKNFGINSTSSPIVVAGLGGGCFSTPWFSFFKAELNDALTVGIEPAECPVNWVKVNGRNAYRSRFGRESVFTLHTLPGIAGWGVDFPLLNLDNVDEILLVEKEAVDAFFEDASRDHIFNFGRSTCACLVGTMGILSDRPPRPIIVPIYDRADLYRDESHGT